MKFRTIYLVAAVVASPLMMPVSSDAAGALIRGRFSYDGIADCQQPSIQNFHFHGEGTATLSTDRTATLDVDSSVSGKTSLNAAVGRTTEAPGGSTRIDVMGKHTLRAVRDYPNNITVVTMTIRGNDCRMTIVDRLKPGKRVYSFYGGSSGSVAYCSHPQITQTQCSAY
jgi:hypothetical protein